MKKQNNVMCLWGELGDGCCVAALELLLLDVVGLLLKKMRNFVFWCQLFLLISFVFRYLER